MSTCLRKITIGGLHATRRKSSLLELAWRDSRRLMSCYNLDTRMGPAKEAKLNIGISGDTPLQQDLTKWSFFDYVTKGGLGYEYAKNVNLPENYYYRRPTRHQKEVIVVGAGIAGLSAAYELAQSGHKVTVLELQHRVGGRAKTIRDRFAKGLHAEGGAMRLPPSHFLTHYYLDLFNVKKRPFQNTNDEGYYCFYGDKVKMKEWNANADSYCTKYWPGWDKNLPKAVKREYNINGIDDYFNCAIKPVIDELKKDTSASGWERWVEKWSKMSVLEFLESDLHQDGAQEKFRPWPDIAIKAYRVKNYMPMMDSSLVEYLRDVLGHWWKDPLSTPVDGMDSLASAFMPKNESGWNKEVCLEKCIHYGIKVDSIEEFGEEGDKTVRVSGRNAASKESVCFTGDAVILTTPLTTVRMMDIESLGRERLAAIEDITYEASTKILLQCRTRFWQTDNNLQGGFSKTNLPIGQLHYPDWQDSKIPSDDRGILMVYTWQQEAQIFGAQTEAEAIENAVKQIAKIHPEIKEEFEVGAVQAWYDEPTAQGAFSFLRPNQFNDSLSLLLKSEHPIYLAGEALSWSNGWIQGAIQSGLWAAYQFYAYNEDGYSKGRKSGVFTFM